jgi:hypothetical protein
MLRQQKMVNSFGLAQESRSGLVQPKAISDPLFRCRHYQVLTGTHSQLTQPVQSDDLRLEDESSITV